MVIIMKKAGFYIIKDEFFEYVSDPYLKMNKTGNRPHYYCFKEMGGEIYWMIPLSSKVEKYKKIIAKRTYNKKPCDILHIVKLDDDRESVFLIQDMFPIVDKYIEREYMICGNHMMITSDKVKKSIEKKARKVLGMLKRGVKFTPTQPDVMAILKKLEDF